MSLIISHSLPALRATIDATTAAQLQSRVLVPVAPISVTAQARQDRPSGSRQESESHQSGSPHQHGGSKSDVRGRIIDIVV